MKILTAQFQNNYHYSVSLILMLCLLGFSYHGNTQPMLRSTVTLAEMIEFAKDKSLDAFEARNNYLTAYWRYKRHRADRLPKVSLISNPVSYNRSVDVIYSVVDSANVITERQLLDSDVKLRVNQNLVSTGGNLFIDTDLGRTQTILPNPGGKQFSATPVRIGVDQPLFAYNRFKWDNRLEPLQYDVAMKNYIRDQEEIAIRSIELFFDLYLAQKRMRLARESYANADTLYQLAKKRFDIAAMQEIDLYSIELDLVSQETDLMETTNTLDRAKMRFCSFLDISSDTNIQLIVPDQLSTIEISEDDAVAKSNIYSPEFARLMVDVIEAESQIDQAKKESFQADLTASFGLNNAEPVFRDAFQNMNQQQRVSVNLDIPILDWGRRRSELKLAQRQYEARTAGFRRSKDDMELEVIMSVRQFNMQGRMLRRVESAEDLARRNYEIAKKRFVIGLGDVAALSQQQTRLSDAAINQVDALREFWTLYFTIRRETLYDFENDTPLTADFESLHNM